MCRSASIRGTLGHVGTLPESGVLHLEDTIKTSRSFKLALCSRVKLRSALAAYAEDFVVGLPWLASSQAVSGRTRRRRILCRGMLRVLPLSQRDLLSFGAGDLTAHSLPCRCGKVGMLARILRELHHLLFVRIGIWNWPHIGIATLARQAALGTVLCHPVKIGLSESKMRYFRIYTMTF